MANSVRTFEDPVSWAPAASERWVPTPADDALVAAKRALGAGWNALAAMLGRPIPSVRRHYDPNYPMEERVDFVVLPKTSQAGPAKAPKVWTPRKTGFACTKDSYRCRIIELLCDGRKRTTVEMIAGVDGPPDSIRSMLSMMRSKGLLYSSARGVYIVTDKGRQEKAGVDAREQARAA